MQFYSNNITNPAGTALAGISVRVQHTDGSDATIYSDNGVTPATNPLTTDGMGSFGFYAANGRYQLAISGNRITPPYTVRDILLYDPASDETDLVGKASNADLANAANGYGVDKVANAAKKVTSIAALKALRVPQGSDAQTVIVDSGSVWVWNALDVRADDALTVINPTVNTGNGRWNLQTKGTSGLGDWSPENSVMIWCGDSTTEQMGGAGYGFDTLISRWRVTGMPLGKLQAVVNFGGSGYRLKNFVQDAATVGFTGPAGTLPGTTAGAGNWDYYGHKPAGSVSEATALAWRAALPSTVKQAIWVICYGINDLILYNDVGNGTPAQIGSTIAGYLGQAVNAIQAQFPNDLIVLRMPNTMTSRPFVSAAGYPSTTAYPTFGNDGPTDAALVDNWNQGLALGYLQAQSKYPRTLLVDTRHYFGYSSTALTTIPSGNQTSGSSVNGNPRLQNLVHPSNVGYDNIVHMVCNALVGTPSTRATYPAGRAYADLLVSQGYTGNAWDNAGRYFNENDSYKRLASYRIVAAGGTFIDLDVPLATFLSVVGGSQNGKLYAQVGENHRDSFAFSFGNYSSLTPTASGANTRILGATIPAGAQVAGATITLYTDASPIIIPSGNSYLVGLVSTFKTYRYQAIGSIVAAGNGYFDFSINPNQNHISSRFFQPTAAMTLAVGGNINTSMSLSGFTKSMNGAASARSMRLFKSGTDFTSYLGADAVIFFDDNAPNPMLQELEQNSYAVGSLAQGTSIFGYTRTKMSNGLASIIVAPTILIPNATTIQVYRHTSNARNLIATLTIAANAGSATGVSGTDFTAISPIAEGELWEAVPTTATGVPTGCALKMTLTPAQ